MAVYKIGGYKVTATNAESAVKAYIEVKKIKDATPHEVVVRTNEVLKEMGKNNSVGKYDRIVQACKSLFGEGFLTGEDLKNAIRREVPRLLKKYNLEDSCKDSYFKATEKVGNYFSGYFVKASTQSEAEKIAKSHAQKYGHEFASLIPTTEREVESGKNRGMSVIGDSQMNPKAGETFKGKMNGAIIEISEVKKAANGETYVSYKDVKTGKQFQTNLATFQTLLLEQVK